MERSSRPSKSSRSDGHAHSARKEERRIEKLLECARQEKAVRAAQASEPRGALMRTSLVVALRVQESRQLKRQYATLKKNAQEQADARKVEFLRSVAALKRQVAHVFATFHGVAREGLVLGGCICMRETGVGGSLEADGDDAWNSTRQIPQVDDDRAEIVEKQEQVPRNSLIPTRPFHIPSMDGRFFRPTHPGPSTQAHPDPTSAVQVRLRTAELGELKERLVEQQQLVRSRKATAEQERHGRTSA